MKKSFVYCIGYGTRIIISQIPTDCNRKYCTKILFIFAKFSHYFSDCRSKISSITFVA